MCNLKETAEAFSKLLSTEYHIIIGKKGRLTEFNLYFSKEHFHHLSGLQKIGDNPHIKHDNRLGIFDEIIAGKITCDSLIANIGFPEVKKRITHLVAMEELMDSNSLVFKYRNNNNGSQIKAKCLLVSTHGDNEIYSF